MTYDIRHNEATSQFETTVDGQTAYAAYELEEPGRIVFTHTIVPEELSGRGIAGELAKKALDYARSEKLTVVPQCAYMARYIDRNPEYKELMKS